MAAVMEGGCHATFILSKRFRSQDDFPCPFLQVREEVLQGIVSMHRLPDLALSAAPYAALTAALAAPAPGSTAAQAASTTTTTANACGIGIGNTGSAGSPVASLSSGCITNTGPIKPQGEELPAVWGHLPLSRVQLYFQVYRAYVANVKARLLPDGSVRPFGLWEQAPAPLVGAMRRLHASMTPAEWMVVLATNLVSASEAGHVLGEIGLQAAIPGTTACEQPKARHSRVAQ